MAGENRRVQYTRNALRGALLALLSEKPITGVTVTEVCARAGVNRSTFYLHYRDAFDLLEQMENELIAEITERLSVSSEVAPRRQIANVLRVVGSHRALCIVILSGHGNPQFIKRLGLQSRAEFLVYWKRLLPQAPERLLELAYVFLITGASAVVEQWLLGNCSEPPEQLAGLLSAFADSCLRDCEALLR